MAQITEKQLPMELIYHIISFVDGHSNLAACSLVCRPWINICRRYIFADFAIFLESDNIVSRLSFLHFTAPHLSEYIVSLYLSRNNLNVSFVPDWIPECFDRFKNLRALYLEEGITNLSSIPAPLALGITSLLSAPRIKELSISDWAFAEDSSELVGMLASCSATLEKLVLESISACDIVADPIHSGSMIPVPSIVCMEALRSLELLQASHPTLKDRLRCPKLESLVVRTPRDVWELPSWVPVGLQELTICTTARRFVPNFGKIIRPALLTIRISGFGLYPMFTSWIQECINRLPFPDRLRQLTMHFGQLGMVSEILYPQPSEYETILHFLQQLLVHGSLERINLSIVVTMESHTRPVWAGDKVRETTKLLAVLAPLLEAKVLHVEFILRQWRDLELEVHWSWFGTYFTE